jgi:uncharacterized protein (DUF1778 family)
MRRDERLELRLTAEEKTAVQDAAAEAGLSVSEWLRCVAMVAAGKRTTLARQLARVRVED